MKGTPILFDGIISFELCLLSIFFIFAAVVFSLGPAAGLYMLYPKAPCLSGVFS